MMRKLLLQLVTGPTTKCLDYNVSDISRRLFPDFLRAQNIVRVIEGKII